MNSRGKKAKKNDRSVTLSGNIVTFVTRRKQYLTLTISLRRDNIKMSVLNVLQGIPNTLI
jgi:hypothetical protein